MKRIGGLLTFCLVAAAVAGVAFAGALEPPGSPAPTMKTLVEVEPRTALAATGPFPITINTPGSYYLTGNLYVPAGVDAIVIDSYAVTLDLNGFSIIGLVAGSSGTGIRINPGHIFVKIHNGTIAYMNTGIKLNNNIYVDIVKMELHATQIYGIDIAGTIVTRVRDNFISSVQVGLRAANAQQLEVRGNTFQDNDAGGLLTFNSTIDITDNSFVDSLGYGIFPSQSVVATIARNRITKTIGDAILLGDQVNAQVVENVIQNSTGKGIDANSGSTTGTIIGNKIYDSGTFGIESASNQITTAGNIVGKSGTGGYNVIAGPRVAPIKALSASPGPWDNVNSDLP